MAPTFPPASGTLVGHRGLGKGILLGHQENTLGSFLAAVDCGLSWVEVDVRRTKDDHLVVAHDPSFPDGTPLYEVAAADAVSRGLLPLQDLMDALPPPVGVLFDIKSALADATRPADATTAALLSPLAAAEAARRPVAASSFDASAVQQVRSQAPDLPVGLLTWLYHPVELAIAAAAHLDVQMLSLHAGSLYPNRSARISDLPALDQVVDVVHAAGRQLVVWCPDDGQLQDLLAAGVDAVIIDDVPRRLTSR